MVVLVGEAVGVKVRVGVWVAVGGGEAVVVGSGVDVAGGGAVAVAGGESGDWVDAGATLVAGRQETKTRSSPQARRTRSAQARALRGEPFHPGINIGPL